MFSLSSFPLWTYTTTCLLTHAGHVDWFHILAIKIIVLLYKNIFCGRMFSEWVSANESAGSQRACTCPFVGKHQAVSSTVVPFPQRPAKPGAPHPCQHARPLRQVSVSHSNVTRIYLLTAEGRPDSLSTYISAAFMKCPLRPSDPLLLMLFIFFLLLSAQYPAITSLNLRGRRSCGP